MALTPEEQRARDAGWTMPEGSDLISHGDDAIRNNATKARSAIAEIRDLQFVASSSVPSGTNWDDLPTGRFYAVTQSLSEADAAAVNAPGPGRWNVFTVENIGDLRIQVAWSHTTIAGRARMMYRGRDSNGWGSWESLAGVSEARVREVEEKMFVETSFVPFGENWNDLEPGKFHSVSQNLTAAQAEALNAPASGRWHVFTMQNAGYLRIQVAWRVTVIMGNALMMYRCQNATEWEPWQSMTGADPNLVSAIESRVSDLEATRDPSGGGPASGFKVVGMPLTVGHSGSDAPLSGTYRLPIDWLAPTVPVSRVKVRLRNINTRNGSTRSGQISLDGIWMGTPDSAGYFAATPAQIAPAVTFDGAEGYESPWVDVPGGTLTDKAISYAYTATSAPWSQLCTGFYADDQVGGSTGTTGFSKVSTAAFTVELIVETYATTPVLAAVGDSNSVGVGAETVSQAWPVMLANRLNAIPQLFGSSGDTCEGSTDSSAFKFNRFPGCSRADSILFALGANDAGGTRSLSQIEGYTEAAISNARHLGGRIYGVAANPRTGESNPDYEDRRREVSSWFAEQRWGLHGYIDFVPTITEDDESIRPEFDADGTHLNAAGFEAIADLVATTYRVTAPAVQYV